MLNLDSQQRYYVLVHNRQLYSSHRPETLAMFFRWTRIPMDKAIHSHNFWVFNNNAEMNGFVARLVRRFDFTFA